MLMQERYCGEKGTQGGVLSAIFLHSFIGAVMWLRLRLGTINQMPRAEK